jgi:hypothetical protein
MPQRGKSRKTAARQTQLGQRKKRQTRGPSGIPVTQPGTEAVEPEDGGGEGFEARPAPARAATAVAQRPTVARPEPRARVYQYVGAEVKRILALGSVTLAILIILAFVIR